MTLSIMFNTITCTCKSARLVLRELVGICTGVPCFGRVPALVLMHVLYIVCNRVMS